MADSNAGLDVPSPQTGRRGYRSEFTTGPVTDAPYGEAAAAADTWDADSVLDVERSAIDRRRRRIAELDAGASRDRLKAPLTGLALSGGGIRSASFCLGVLQGLQSDRAIDGIDYLSTVSGGGYAGCCLTGCMSLDGRFPFIKDDRYSDTDAVRHIRDYSNYLIPRGAMDVVTALGLVGRGLAANAVLTLPFMLISAGLLIACYPDVAALDGPGPLARAAGIYLPALSNMPILPGFPLTTALLIAATGVLAIWAFAKSYATSDLIAPTGIGDRTSAELRGGFADAWKVLFLAVVACAWLELQPIALRVMAHPWVPFSSCTAGQAQGCLGALLKGWLSYATPALAPLGAIVTFFSQRIALAARLEAPGGPSGTVRRFVGGVLLGMAAIVVPSVLWLACLELALDCMSRGYPATSILAGAAAAAGAACLINPNATSLHRMYRDRLSKAFLFDPNRHDVHGDLKAHAPKIHRIDTDLVPYPIVNAALNIEGSAYANKRGRNADFFVFTPEFTGSDATGYVGTERMEAVEPKLDLGTAMAISGAAVSPNMGSATIRPLVPTLALLNVRLGYWLTNPARAAAGVPGLLARLLDIRSFLLFKEIFGLIDEKSPNVYLTDGGNIENLGVYSLLKRRCGLIVAIDAEADPSMGFGSLLRLERFARGDLGAIIEVPWQEIAERTLQVDAAFATGTPARAGGHHVAACDIRYGPEETGVLIYVKASLTGDEDDYVLDYKRRNPDFPHETTSDQFFGEEQLEVYRSLGFHSASGIATGLTQFAVRPRDGENAGDARRRMTGFIKAALGV